MGCGRQRRRHRHTAASSRPSLSQQGRSQGLMEQDSGGGREMDGDGGRVDENFLRIFLRDFPDSNSMEPWARVGGPGRARREAAAVVDVHPQEVAQPMGHERTHPVGEGGGEGCTSTFLRLWGEEDSGLFASKPLTLEKSGSFTDGPRTRSFR